VFAAATLPSLALLLGNQHGWAGIGLIGIGTAVALWAGTRRELSVSPAVLWGALIVLAGAAVARAPMGSHDLWSYAMQGRILEHYHANPYVSVPARFAPDPILARAGWQHTPTPYGPLFVAFAALVSRVAGTNLVALRLGFQIPVSLAVLASIGIAMHATKSQTVAALAGLQPFVWCAVVNGGHNDAFLGLAAVAAVMFIARGRPASAGVALALGGLVKPTVLLAFPVLLVVLFARSGPRAALRAFVGAAVPTALGVAIASASVTAASRVTRGLISRASPWRLLTQAHVLASGRASIVSIGLAIVIACVAGWRSRTGGDLAGAAAIALLAYVVVGSYVLVWYSAWSVVIAAMSRRRAIGVFAVIHGALLFAAYQVGSADAAQRLGHGFLTIFLPVLTVTALVWLMLQRGERRFSAFAPASRG